MTKDKTIEYYRLRELKKPMSEFAKKIQKKYKNLIIKLGKI